MLQTIFNKCIKYGNKNKDMIIVFSSKQVSIKVYDAIIF